MTRDQKLLAIATLKRALSAFEEVEEPEDPAEAEREVEGIVLAEDWLNDMEAALHIGREGRR